MALPQSGALLLFFPGRENGRKEELMTKNAGVRRALQILFQTVCTLAFLYLLTVFAYRMAVADRGSKLSAVSRFAAELNICAFFAMLAADIFRHIFTWHRSTVARVLGWILRIFVILICAVHLCLMTLIASFDPKDSAKEVDYVLVLGLALENGRASGDLIRRVEQAIRIQSEYPEAEFIFSGGTHDDLVQTEAVIMVMHFVDMGGDPDHAHEESKSQDTIQNFKNIGEMTGMNIPVAVVTSDYHMFRTAGIMKKQGWTFVRYVSAPSDRILYPENLLWESSCVITGILMKTFSMPDGSCTLWRNGL